MKKQRKVLVRNLVIAMVAADAVGIYFLKDRLNGAENPTSIEEEALAAANQRQPATHMPRQELAQAQRELPKPTFGQAVVPADQTAEAKPATLPVVTQAKVEKPAAPVLAAAPAPAKPAIAAAPAPAKPKLAAAPAKPKLALAPAPVAKAAPVIAKPAAPRKLAAATPAKRVIKVAPAASSSRSLAPRQLSSVSTRKPVTLSVMPSAPARLTRTSTVDSEGAPKRTKFGKAFDTLSPSSPSPLVTTSAGSLQQTAAPAVAVEFAPQVEVAPVIQPAPVIAVTPQVSEPLAQIEVSPVKEAGQSPAPTSVEMPAKGG